jgi:hypothetical protein
MSQVKAATTTTARTRNQMSSYEGIPLTIICSHGIKTGQLMQRLS